jgi:hypothetical protein
VPAPHQVYGFLTTPPNAVVEPIHPKAMPVILTADEQRDVWMVHRGTKPRHCNGRCRMMRLESFARCGQGRSGGGLIGLNGLMSLNASRNAEWETTAVTTELPKEGADRRMWVAEVLTGAPAAFARGSVSATLQRR